jgi:indole-3-glycerol phosphate synthase
MNVLDQIITSKKLEVEQRRKTVPMDELTQFELFKKPVVSLSNSLKNGTGLIVEFKRKSPSAGNIQERSPEEVINFYTKQEVSAFSVLTDNERFGGGVDDLKSVRKITNGPILRKEFIIDEYQIFEAKAYGADAILLIAEALDDYHATYLTTIAHSLGLEVLMEFHSHKELNKLNDAVDVIGINNRNLQTLETDLSTSRKLLKYLPYDKVKITESGIKKPEELKYLYSLGYEGCLIGEAVLKDLDLLPLLCNAAMNAKLTQNET